MDRRIQKTRAAIQQAYIRLLPEKGMEKITVSEIARQANIDRKTFYLHYAGTEDILKEICGDKIRDFQTRLLEAEKTGEPFTLEQMFNISNQLLAENIQLVEILVQQQNARYYFDQIKQMLVDAITENYGRQLGFNSIDLRLYSEFYISGIISAYRLWMNKQIPLTVEELAQRLAAASLKGMEYLMRQEAGKKSEPC